MKVKLSEQLRDAGLEGMALRADKLESVAWRNAFDNALKQVADYEVAREHADKVMSVF